MTPNVLPLAQQGLVDHPWLLSVLLGIIEGLTEFLPVSSTAHIRIVQGLTGVDLESAFWKMYAVVIQLGAILAVVVYFRQRIAKFVSTFPRGDAGDRTAFNHPLSLVMLAFVVTAIPAFLLSRLISDNLESLLIMALSLIIGGVVMWVIDVIFGRREARLATAFEEAPPPPGFGRFTPSMEQMTWTQAAWIGAVQVLSAVFPGTSRSMSTIAAGQVGGLSRSAALEFSFFVSIPVMFTACGYDLLKTLRADPGDPQYLAGGVTGEQWVTLAIGFGVSFLVAWAVIAWFMAWVRRHGFVPFAIYRIIVGLGVLAWVLVGTA